MLSSDVYSINPGIKSGSFPSVYQKRQQTTYSDIDPSVNARVKTSISYDEFNRPESTNTESSTFNALNQMVSKSVNISGNKNKNYYQINPMTYDDNGNLLRERFTDGRPIDSQYVYGLDNQLLWNVSETKHDEWRDPVNNVIDCYNRTEKWYTYELDGLHRKVKSNIHDSVNPMDIFKANYVDVLYYSHDGVAAELHDDVNSYKYFTRLGGELLACDNMIHLTFIFKISVAM